MYSKVDIFNMALSAVGASSTVSEENEVSREAEVCNRWYKAARDTALGMAPWPEARGYARLAKSSERIEGHIWTLAGPAPAYRFSFAVPADLIKPFHLQSFQRFEYSGRTISCAESAPILYYIKRLEDVTKWENPLTMSVVFTLASYIAMPLTGKDDVDSKMMQKAMLISDEMTLQVVNTESVSMETIPSFISARGYSQFPSERYFYSFGSNNIEKSL